MPLGRHQMRFLPHPPPFRSRPPPEACLTCHSGPPHPDDEAYFASAHEFRYLAEGKDWNWSKPLRKGNYPVPTCAYCHMGDGRHQVADMAIWIVRPEGSQSAHSHTAENRVKHRRWIAPCPDCHDEKEAKIWPEDLDREHKSAWLLLDDAERLLRKLRSDDLLSPRPGERPPYPVDCWEKRWPRARIAASTGDRRRPSTMSPASSAITSRCGISTTCWLTRVTRAPPTVLRTWWQKRAPPDGGVACAPA